MLCTLPLREVRSRLAHEGLNLVTGPFTFRVRSALPEVARTVALHYAHHASPSVADQPFADFHVEVRRPSNLRRWIRPQVLFEFDGLLPFEPMPGNQGYPILEWGMNWCITTHCHQYLNLHAGVLERQGRVLIMPAPPGSGKSTLTAALSLRGWRLFSDELALLEPATGLVVPMPRPVSLKNQSIDVIRRFDSQAVLNEAVHETAKGSVAHLSPTPSSVEQVALKALPGWVVLPQYQAGAPTQLEPLSRARAFMALVDNAFNYSVHGLQGFHALAELVQRCNCYRFTYSRLDEAMELFAQLQPGPAETETAVGV